MLSHKGEPESGLEYIGVARVHPHVVHFCRLHFARYVEEIRGDLSDENVEAALERGEKLNSKEVVSELLLEAEAA